MKVNVLIMAVGVLASLWLLRYAWVTLNDALLGIMVIGVACIPFVLLFWAVWEDFMVQQQSEDSDE
jgi:hypothetical protein